MSTSHATRPDFKVNIKTTITAPTQLLRIRLEHPSHLQLLSQPDTSTYPGYGFVALFANAQLSDANAAPLHSGTVDVRVRPEAITQTFLTMLSRITEQSPCDFEFVVNGTHTVGAGPKIATVIAESIFACSLGVPIP